MSEEQLECRDMTCDVINGLLNKACYEEFGRAVGIALRMCRQYFEQYEIAFDEDRLVRAFQGAYSCMFLVLDYQSREVLTRLCERGYAEKPENFVMRLEDRIDPCNKYEWEAAKALCDFWRVFNEMEGGAK